MKKSDIPNAIKAFKQQFSPIQPLKPRLIGFSWAIGTRGNDVVLARKYPPEIYEFSLMTMENYKHYTKEN